MPDEQTGPQMGHFDQPDWKPETVTQIAQQTVYNTYTGQTPPPADEKRHYFTVPFPRNADFVGREVDLTNLHAALTSGDPVGIHSAIGQDLPGFGKPGRSDAPAGLTGQGGMGKTALAVEYCYRHRDDYAGGVFWVNAAEPLAQGFAALGCLIDPANFDRPVPRQIDAAARYLNSHPDALLVLDNVEDPASLSRPVATGLIPTQLVCQVLFTTRRRDLPARCRPVEVTVLPEAAALALLLRHLARQPSQQPAHPQHTEAKRICRRLGYLPLALEIAGGFLGEWPEIGLADFRARLESEGALATLDEEGAELSPANLPAIHAAALTATLRTQWEALTNDDARLLLRVAGQLPEAAQIPTARLGLLAGLDDDERPGRPSRLQRALRRLELLSLVEELRGDELRLHPLVREFAQSQISNLQSFRAVCAENLHRAYSDIATLESHCARRGVVALEADLTSAIHLLADPQSPISQSLQSLQRILERESHTLRGWEAERQPVHFAQQLRHRAVLGQEERLMAETATRLATLARRYLLVAWATNRTSPEMIRVLTGHDDWVNAVVVMPDGRRTVSASDDGTLRVWDLESGAEEQVLTGHADWVNAVAVMPDGSLVVSASSDGSLREWNWESGAEQRVLTGHKSSVRSVAVTPDGRRAVSTSDDRTLRVWDLKSGVEKRVLTGHTSGVNGVAVTPDGRAVVSASDDRTLRVWDLESGAELRVLAGHKASVRSVAVTPDGKRAVSASDDRTLRVWDLESGAEKRVLTGHKASVRSVAVTPDGRQAVSASDDRTLRVWDLEIGIEEQVLIGHESNVLSVVITPDGRRAVSVSHDRTLRVWDIQSRAHKRVLIGHASSVNAVAVEPDGRAAVSKSSDGTLRVWDLESGAEEQVLTGHADWVNAVAVTPDGRCVVLASSGGALRVWDLESGEEERVLKGHASLVLSVAVTPDSRRAVSASEDSTLRIWNLDTGAEERVLTGHTSGVLSVVVTTDGRRAVSASDDRTLRVWDVESGAEERVLTGHTSGVLSVVVTTDERRAVSASDDRTLRVWDLQSGEELAMIALDGAVTAVAVAPNGTTIVAGDAGGNVYCLEYVE